eukprot:4306-Heterococcus_DN1.PRE.2
MSYKALLCDVVQPLYSTLSEHINHNTPSSQHMAVLANSLRTLVAVSSAIICAAAVVCAAECNAVPALCWLMLIGAGAAAVAVAAAAAIAVQVGGHRYDELSQPVVHTAATWSSFVLPLAVHRQQCQRLYTGACTDAQPTSAAQPVCCLRDRCARPLVQFSLCCSKLREEVTSMDMLCEGVRVLLNIMAYCFSDVSVCMVAGAACRASAISACSASYNIQECQLLTEACTRVSARSQWPNSVMLMCSPCRTMSTCMAPVRVVSCWSTLAAYRHTGMMLC